MNDEHYLTVPNWKHLKTGGTYEILGFATQESSGDLMVLYRSSNAGSSLTEPIWSRPACEFFDGRFVRLFPGIKLEDWK